MEEDGFNNNDELEIDEAREGQVPLTQRVPPHEDENFKVPLP